jgi:hypothetical protein
VSETLQCALAVKPYGEVPDNFDFTKDIPKIMNSQRTIQNTKPPNEKLYIGGKMLFLFYE